MLGLLLIFSATLAHEASVSIGKGQVRAHHETWAILGFLSFFWGTAWFGISALLGWGPILFSQASIPTLLLRIIFEISIAYVGTKAIIRSDRSTFAFFHLVTIPLLLAVDTILGYQLSLTKIAGIGLITLSLGYLLLARGVSRKGGGTGVDRRNTGCIYHIALQVQH